MMHYIALQCTTFALQHNIWKKYDNGYMLQLKNSPLGANLLESIDSLVCNTLQRTATHCNALQRTATHYNALQRAAADCNTTFEEFVTMVICFINDFTCGAKFSWVDRFTRLHHTTTLYLINDFISGANFSWVTATLHLKDKWHWPYAINDISCGANYSWVDRFTRLHHTTTHCNALQRTATRCNALQRAATLHLKNKWQWPYCNTTFEG